MLLMLLMLLLLLLSALTLPLTSALPHCMLGALLHGWVLVLLLLHGLLGLLVEGVRRGRLHREAGV